MVPETKYARSSDLRIAYQVFGHGPVDLVIAPAFLSHMDVSWEWPGLVRVLSRFSSFARVIWFDKRGSGLSDRIGSFPTLEEMMDDLRAVIEASGAKKPALFGWNEGAALCSLFAASHPDDLTSLILYAPYPSTRASADYPGGLSSEGFDAMYDLLDRAYGTREFAEWSAHVLAPSLARDETFITWLHRMERNGASPGAALACLRLIQGINVTDICRAVHVPTLVIARTGDRFVPIGASRWVAENVPNAQLAELPGNDNFPFVGDSDLFVDEIEKFLTGSMNSAPSDRILASVLFTDIVGSTQKANDLGDQRWRALLEAHDALLRAQVTAHSGRAINAIGDGFLATFDGPARAIRCAWRAMEGARSLGLTLRAGIHTGEIELRDNDISGIAVHIGARVAALANADEVLVSSTVKDLVIGSGITFTDRGNHQLKGISGTWNLFAAQS